MARVVVRGERRSECACVHRASEGGLVDGARAMGPRTELTTTKENLRDLVTAKLSGFL